MLRRSSSGGKHPWCFSSRKGKEGNHTDLLLFQPGPVSSPVLLPPFLHVTLASEASPLEVVPLGLYVPTGCFACAVSSVFVSGLTLNALSWTPLLYLSRALRGSLHCRGIIISDVVRTPVMQTIPRELIKTAGLTWKIV